MSVKNYFWTTQNPLPLAGNGNRAIVTSLTYNQSLTGCGHQLFNMLLIDQYSVPWSAFIGIHHKRTAPNKYPLSVDMSVKNGLFDGKRDIERF